MDLNQDHDGQTSMRGSTPLAKKPRPSRARGLRVNTGCTTCRRRRVKCDETKPRCNQCGKSGRQCTYAQPKPPRQRSSRTQQQQQQQGAKEHQQAECPPQAQDVQPQYQQQQDQNTQNVQQQQHDAESTGPPLDRFARDGSLHLDGRDDEAPASTVPLLDHPACLLSLSTTDTILADTITSYPPPADIQPRGPSEIGFSPLASQASSAYHVSATDWYDLVAQDAIDYLEKNPVPFDGYSWSFDVNSLSRKQSPDPEQQQQQQQQQPKPAAASMALSHDDNETLTHGPSLGKAVTTFSRPSMPGPQPAHITSPWNTVERIVLDLDEQFYLQYFISTVAPILDLMDLSKQFANVVPHLALHNVGLLKAVLATSARHMALYDGVHEHEVALNQPPHIRRRSTGVSHHRDRNNLVAATQYYYETLQYLSQNLLHSAYSYSPEIVATAVLISMYEMFDSSRTGVSRNWERHLRGSFWIQRSQDNDGEMVDLLRRACWWVWVRQDIWAALREGRRSLTIFRPRKSLESLNAEELATRIIFLTARCVDYAAHAKMEQDMNECILHGDKLLRELDRWYHRLSPAFHPIHVSQSSAQASMECQTPMTLISGAGMTSSVGASEPWEHFVPLWVHPPTFAAAMQMYHFARILVVLNQPTTGGRSAFLKRQKMLDQSVDTICGIASGKQAEELPSAFVNSQALFVAGLCTQTQAKKGALLKILERSLAISKVPHESLADDLKKIWEADE